MLLLTFTLNQTKFGIPLEEVEYIVSDVCNVESSMVAKHIRGTAILRDEVVPIYNLISRFEFEEQTIGRMIVVVGSEGKKLGLEVGMIAGMKYMEEFIYADIPPIIQKDKLCIKHAVSYENEIILVLDIAKLLCDAE